MSNHSHPDRLHLFIELLGADLAEVSGGNAAPGITRAMNETGNIPGPPPSSPPPSPPIVTTLAVGEEGGVGGAQQLTRMLGEDGGNALQPAPGCGVPDPSFVLYGAGKS